VNNFTAIARRISPKNFLKTNIAPLPNAFSTKLILERTKYTTSILRTRAIIIFIVAYSALIVKSVVNVPVPAISGKITGTSVTELLGPSFLKISTPKIISIAKTRIIKEPATANEDISTPNRESIISPRNRNTIQIMKEYIVAFGELMFFPLDFKSKIMGTDPVISITANSTIKVLTISLKLIFQSISMQIYSLQIYHFLCKNFVFFKNLIIFRKESYTLNRYTNMKKLIDEIKAEIDVFTKNADAQLVKGNKAAGTRARKAALNLSKMMKEFRKVSVESSK